MSVYYNEFDPFAAAWLRKLIKAGLIADGTVDERSIVDVEPDDLAGFTQCHFFAGIGVWSYALRCAGWPDDRPVWTGSCPCQPFSVAGKGKGAKDDRHLWPEFYRLIAECSPSVVFGEQVASKAGRAWLDDVQTDLEALDFAVGAADLCAAGVGAPHIRQRLYWVGNAIQSGLEGRPRNAQGKGETTAISGASCGLADSESAGRSIRHPQDFRATDAPGYTLANAGDSAVDGEQRLASEHPGPTSGHWRDADWLFCRDAKWRAVEPGTFPLADGAPARVGRLRGYGNAIVAVQAQAFVESYIAAQKGGC